MEEKGLKASGSGNRSLACWNCGEPISGSWPAPGNDHCVGCNSPLGEPAFRSDVARVRRSLQLYIAVRTVLIFGAVALFLAGVYVPSLNTPGNLSPPQGLVILFVALLVLSAVVGVFALVVNRVAKREAMVQLTPLGLGTTAAVAVATSLFPLEAITQLRRWRRLGLFEPVPAGQSNIDLRLHRSELQSPEHSGYFPARAGRSRSPGRTVAYILVGIFLLVLLLMIVPLPLPYSTTLESSAITPNGSQVGSSDCVSISGSWSTTDGGSVTLVILDGKSAPVYTADASSGTFSFNASSPPYMVTAVSILPEVVDVSGVCWGPLISVGLP